MAVSNKARISNYEGQLKIAAAIQEVANTLGAHYKADSKSGVRSFAGLQALCRIGNVKDYVSVGDQITCARGSDTLTWDVVHIGDAGDVGGEEGSNYVALMMHDCFKNTLQFDQREAFFYADKELPAGTYHFKTEHTNITDTAWDEWKKTLQFTIKTAVPAGGQIAFSTDTEYNKKRAGNAKIITYSSQTSTTALETVDCAEGTSGTDLSTLGDINNSQRVCYGYNNYKQSAIRQFLNSGAAAGSVWTPQNKFNRPPTWAATQDGFMNGLDSDFLNAVQQVKINVTTNKITDGNTVESMQDKFFLPTSKNINGTRNDPSHIEDTTIWDYYTKFRRDGKTGESYDDDPNRIKYIGTGKVVWWLRSCTLSDALNVRRVSTSGYVAWAANACYANGVAPACYIF